MKTILMASAYLLASVVGETQSTAARGPIGGMGFGQSGTFGACLRDEETQQSRRLFEQAGRSPRKTSSVSFNFNPGNVSDDDSTWTWRVNVTAVAVPHDLFNKSGLHVVNSQWDIQWPGAGSLQSFMERTGSEGKLCMSIAEIGLPSNITRRYSNPGDCSTVLGSACVRRLLDSTACTSPPDYSYAGIEECMDVLLPQVGSMSESISVSNSTVKDIQSGNALYSDTSPGLPAANVSRLNTQAETRLNVLILQSTGTASTMVCQIVNPEASSGADARSDGYMIGAVVIMSWALVLFC